VLNAFSYFAKNALNDFTIEEVDPADLVGCFFQADVTHDVQPNKNDPNKTVTWIRLNNWKPSKGFAEKGQTKKAPSIWTNCWDELCGRVHFKESVSTTLKR
jgi:hypothetical protein